MKKFLRTPEEVVQALQEGNKVQTDYMEYWFRKGVFFSLNKKDGYVCINSNVLFIPDCMYVEEPKPLKIEVGKFYRTRGGKKALVYARISDEYPYPYYVAKVGMAVTYSVNADGRRTDEENAVDLVAPWEE